MLPPSAAYGRSSEQYAWLLRDLAALDRARTPWVIAVFHAPWYNSNYAHQVRAASWQLPSPSAASPAGVLPALVVSLLPGAARGAPVATQTPYSGRGKLVLPLVGAPRAVGVRQGRQPTMHRPMSPLQGEGDAMRDSMEDLLYQHGVDLVFAG